MSRSYTRRTNGGSACGTAQLLMPPGGRIKDIDSAVMQIIEEHWQQLIEAWDAKYPENPVSSAEDGDDTNDNDV